MATKILLKKSNVTTAQPQTSDLDHGELAINYEDGILYYKTNSGVIDIIARKSAGGTSGITITPISSNYTAAGGDYLLADTSGGSFTITLPQAPVTGSFVTIFDADSWTDNPLIFDSGVNSIEGSGSTINVDVGNVRIDLVYNGSTWKTHIPIDSQYLETRLTQFEDDVITYAIALG